MPKDKKIRNANPRPEPDQYTTRYPSNMPGNPSNPNANPRPEPHQYTTRYGSNVKGSSPVSKRGSRSKSDLQDKDRKVRDYNVAEDDWDLRRAHNTKEGQQLQKMQIAQATKHRLARAAKRKLGQR